jgi:heat shock protein HtpX
MRKTIKKSMPRPSWLSQNAIMSFETLRNLRLAFAGPHAASNILQAGLLLAAFSALVGLACWPVVGLPGAAAIAVVAALAILLLALQVPPRMAMWLYGARRHEPGSLKQEDALVAELAQRAALTRIPALYVIPSTMLSAFSFGSTQRSAIALTETLLRRLTMREIAGVLAHEISHMCLGDLVVFGIADIVTRCAQALYYVGAALAALNLWRLITGDDLVSWLTVAILLLAPALMNLLQLNLSRKREFAADRAAALITGDPMGLASAITRLETPAGRLLDDLTPPVPARRVPLPSLLRFPGPAEPRIARLRALEPPPMPPLTIDEGPRISLVGVGPIQMRPRYRWPGIWF